MYGRAMKCDICDTVKIVDIDESVYLVDNTLDGWIRIHVNRPLQDRYTHRTQRRSNIVQSVDCCTLMCASNFIRSCGEDSTEVAE